MSKIYGKLKTRSISLHVAFLHNSNNLWDSQETLVLALKYTTVPCHANWDAQDICSINYRKEVFTLCIGMVWASSQYISRRLYDPHSALLPCYCPYSLWYCHMSVSVCVTALVIRFENPKVYVSANYYYQNPVPALFFLHDEWLGSLTCTMLARPIWFHWGGGLHDLCFSPPTARQTKMFWFYF